MSIRHIPHGPGRSIPPHRNVLGRCLAVAALGGGLILCVRPAHGQGGGGEDPALLFGDSKRAAEVVAKVGPIEITALQFFTSYEFGPAFPKRQKDSKRRYLEFMLYEKLLALDAYNLGLQSSPLVIRSLAEIEGDLVTEELYKEDVLRKVTVSEEELAEAIAGQRIHYSLQWLYAPTRTAIMHFQELLNHDVPFDSVFISQLGDSLNPDVRSLETTRFKLRLRNPTMAAVVDTLKPQIPSTPVEGPDGWYIVRIVRGGYDALTPDAEQLKQRSDAQRALTQQKADALSDQYVHQMMLDHDPVIVRKTFNLLQASIGRLVLPAKKFSDWGLDSVSIASIDRSGNDTLVTLRNGNITLRQFLTWYWAREKYVSPSISSQDAFFVSLQQVVWRMVRDRLLVTRAFRRGLQEREIVKTQKKWWEEKILYDYRKKLISDSIKPDEQTLRRYFDEHRRDYRSTTGDTVTYARAKDDVRRDCASLELTTRLLHRILALKQKYPIDIREETLRKLPVVSENDPRAIDVYVAKKGGVFPHPAYPTIDMEWQAWR